MDKRQAIMYLEYLREKWAEKDSPYWNAITEGIEALKKIDDVQSCLGKQVQNETDR